MFFPNSPGTQLKRYLEYHGVIAVSEVKQGAVVLHGDVDGLQYECKSVLQLYEHYQYSSYWRNILDRSFLHIKSADQQMMATY